MSVLIVESDGKKELEKRKSDKEPHELDGVAESGQEEHKHIARKLCDVLQVSLSASMDGSAGSNRALNQSPRLLSRPAEICCCSSSCHGDSISSNNRSTGDGSETEIVRKQWVRLTQESTRQLIGGTSTQLYEKMGKRKRETESGLVQRGRQYDEDS